METSSQNNDKEDEGYKTSYPEDTIMIDNNDTSVYNLQKNQLATPLSPNLTIKYEPPEPNQLFNINSSLGFIQDFILVESSDDEPDDIGPPITITATKLTLKGALQSPAELALLTNPSLHEQSTPDNSRRNTARKSTRGKAPQMLTTLTTTRTYVLSNPYNTRSSSSRRLTTVKKSTGGKALQIPTTSTIPINLLIAKSNDSELMTVRESTEKTKFQTLSMNIHQEITDNATSPLLPLNKRGHFQKDSSETASTDDKKAE